MRGVPSSSRSPDSPRTRDAHRDASTDSTATGALDMRREPASSATTAAAILTTSQGSNSSTSAPTRTFAHLWQRIAGSPASSNPHEDHRQDADDDDDDDSDNDNADHSPSHTNTNTNTTHHHRRSTSVPMLTTNMNEVVGITTPASPPSSSSGGGGFLSSRFSIDPEPVMSRLRRVQQQRTSSSNSAIATSSPSSPSAMSSLSPSRLSGSWDRFRPRWPLGGGGTTSINTSPSNARTGEASGTDSEDDHNRDGDKDMTDPLDGDEGVVVDDEACFVDCWQGKVDFLSSFPNEISLFILLHLDHTSLLTASAVSRQWRSLALDNLIWRDLFHQQPGWRIREPTYASASSLASSTYYDAPTRPPSIRRTVTSAMRREGSSRSTRGAADGVPETPTRLTRRISDMVDTLGSLSLTPLGSRSASVRGDDDMMTTSTSSDASWTHASSTSASSSQLMSASSTAAPRRQALSVMSAAAPSTSTISTNAFATPPSTSRSTSTSRLPISRTSSSSALANLASSISHLPPSLGPSRRTSSATLPPLGSIPSPSLGSTPSAPLTLNWPRLFRDRYILEQRWQHATPQSAWFKGHTDSVYCLQFDSRKIISGSRDRTIRVWDIATGRTTKVLSGHEGSVLCLRYDDKVLVTGSSDSRILVWDLVGEPGTGKGQWEVVMQMVGHSMGVLDLCFDEQWIVSCSKDTTIRVWHRSTGELYRVLAGHRGPVNAVQLHGNRIVSASGDATMKMWNVLTGEVERVFSGHDRGLACVTISSSGALLASGSNDKTIRVWDVETGACLAILKGHTDLVRSLAFDEVRGVILSGSYDRTTRVWDWKGETELAKYKQHTSLVFHVEFNASRIVSSSHDQKILSLDFGEGLDTSLFL